MQYKKGFKYQLTENFYYKLTFNSEEFIELPFIELNNNQLLVKKGYAWDGPSGPTWDTKTFMAGSLVHDVLYQLMRMELISITFREASDKELRKICLMYRMCKIRAWYTYWAVRFFANSAALPENIKEIIKV